MNYHNPTQYKLTLGSPYGINAYAIWTDAIKVAGYQGEIFLVTGSRLGFSLDVTEPTPVMFFGMESGQLVDLSKKLNLDSIASVITRNLLLADFNEDGLTDIFLGNHGTEKFTPLPGEQNQLLLQRSDGTFVDATKNLPTLTDFTHGPDFGDLNGDGKVDIFVNNLGDDDSNASYILSNDGNAKFTYLADTSLHKNGVFDTGLSDYVGSPLSLIVDVDGDGQNDIFCGAFSKWDDSSKTLVDFGAGYLRNENGSFKITFDSDLNFPANSSTVFAYRKADFNLDGREDVLVAGAQPNGQLLLQVYYSGSDGLKNASNTAIDLKQISKLVINGGIDLQVVDIDGNGSMDFEVRGYSENFTSEVRYTFFNQGSGKFDSPVKDLGGVAAARGSYVDLNGDGQKDFIHQVGDNLEVLFAKASIIKVAPYENELAAQAYRLYKAAFDRTPDMEGLGYWINAFDDGAVLTGVASAFIGSPEFAAMYGANSTDTNFVTLLYNHVLHRDPDAEGNAYWLNALQNGVIRGAVLALFSESPENIAQTAPLIANGIQYQEWIG